MPAALLLDPQLLSRASGPPNGDGWIHEIKYDGYRLLASLERGLVSLWSRPGADWTSRLPTIANAIAELTVRSAALDGELVYLGADGFPDFEKLQSATRSAREGARLYYTEGDGTEFFRAADELGLEGIVCKRARSVYRAGIRSRYGTRYSAKPHCSKVVSRTDGGCETMRKPSTSNPRPTFTVPPDATFEQRRRPRKV